MQSASAVEFPPVESADEDGLLAIGGDLSAQTLLAAYRQGIFPWFNEGEPILWWCPDPRFVMIPKETHVSRSMQKIFKRNEFIFSIDEAFTEVVEQCSRVPRKDQDGTWITAGMKNAYTNLHQLGYAHSAEAWQEGVLVGGIYGVRLGKVFFGESMFSNRNNASKFAFLRLVENLRKDGVELIDCQVHSTHVESLGARMISRKEFTARLLQLIDD